MRAYNVHVHLYTGDQASTSFIMEGKTRSSKSNPSFLYISGNMVACGRASTRRPMFTIWRSGNNKMNKNLQKLCAVKTCSYGHWGSHRKCPYKQGVHYGPSVHEAGFDCRTFTCMLSDNCEKIGSTCKKAKI